MLERISSFAKVSVLLTLFFLPVLAAQWRTDVSAFWKHNQRIEAPQGRNSLAHYTAENHPANQLPGD